MKIQYADTAVDNLKKFNSAERALIVKKIHYLADNFEALKTGKKLRELKGTEYKNQYRFTIARKIRAIFRVEDEKLILMVLRIGLRKDVYE